MITIDMKRNVLKKSFMYWMNGRIRGQRYIIKKPFTLLYPNITNLFNLLKKEFGYTCIHSLITTIESDLIFSIIYKSYHSENPFICGSVHDAIFVKKEFQNKLESIFKESSKELLNNTPNIKTK